MLTRVGVASARFFLTHLRCIRHVAVEMLIQKTYNHLKRPRACGVTGKGLSPRLLPAAGPTYSFSCNVAGLSVQRAGDQLRAVAQGFECSNITITTSLTSFSFAHNNTFSFCSRLPPPPPDSKGLCHWSEAFLKLPHSAGEQRVKIQEF